MAIARLSILGLALVAAACNTTQKSRRTCENEVTALKVGIFEAEAFLQDQRPQIREGYKALDDCSSRAGPCRAADWLDYAQILRLEHRAASDGFELAVNQFNPDACVAHIQSFRIDPPRPQTYQGYYYTFEETGAQIDELISAFGKRAG